MRMKAVLTNWKHSSIRLLRIFRANRVNSRRHRCLLGSVSDPYAKSSAKLPQGPINCASRPEKASNNNAAHVFLSDAQKAM